MLWPCPPRRTLCVLCLATCESIVSSFGVGGTRATAAVVTSNSLSMTGLQDGGGSNRKGLPAARAVAEAGTTAQPIAVPTTAVEGEERVEMEDDELSTPMGSPPPLPKLPPRLPSIQDGERARDTIIDHSLCTQLLYSSRTVSDL